MNCSHSTLVTARVRGLSLFRHSVFTVWILLVSILFGSITPAFAEDHNSNQPPLDERSYDNLVDPTSVVQPIVDKNPAQTKSSLTFIENQDRILDEVFRLAQALDEKTPQKWVELGQSTYQRLVKEAQRQGEPVPPALNDEQILELGKKEYARLVAEGKSKEFLGVSIDGLGKAEATMVKPGRNEKGVIITRVVHDEIGWSFLLIDERIPLDSEHLGQLIGRQHMDADNFKGRPVMIVRTANWNVGSTGQSASAKENASLVYRPKPTTFGEWYRVWKAATLVRPSAGDVILGMGCGILQAGVVCGLGELQKMIDPIHAKPYTNSSILAAAFGTVIGAWSSSYRNITNRGLPNPKWSNAWQTAKTATVSVAFAYGIYLMDHGVKEGMKSLLLIDPAGMLTTTSVMAGLLAHTNMVSNVIINNYTKNYWASVSRIREDMGLSRSEYKLTDKISFKRSSLEYSGINLIPFGLKLAALTGFYVSIPVLGNFDAGKIAFISSIVWVQYLALKYAESLRYEKAPALRARWEGFPLVRIYNLIKKMASPITESIASQIGINSSRSCETLLTKQDPNADGPKSQDVDSTRGTGE